MPEQYLTSKPSFKCEGCGARAYTRQQMKKHIYWMRKDRNKDGRNHR